MSSMMLLTHTPCCHTQSGDVIDGVCDSLEGILHN